MRALAVRHRWGLHAAVIVIALAMTLAGAHLAWAANLDLPVPRITIYPGDTIAADQLTDRAFVAASVTRSSVFDDRRAVVGKVARRALLAGQPIPVNAIRDPYLVHNNKPTLVVFETGGLTITVQAVAQQNGAAGDVVTLRNPDSGLIIQGTVERDGTVRLGAP